MGAPLVIFVFNKPPGSQWVSLTGGSGKLGFCTPLMGLVDDGGGDMQIQSNDLGVDFPYGNKTVRIYPSDAVTLAVGKGKKPRISFVVLDKDGNTTAYALGGLALKPKAIAVRNGGASFPELKVTTSKSNATVLTLTNDPDQGPHDKVIAYDFWVMVQNADGEVGLIDPLITNVA